MHFSNHLKIFRSLFQELVGWIVLIGYQNLRKKCGHLYTLREHPPDAYTLCFSNISTEQMLYTESDIEISMDKIETINFHQVSSRLFSRGWVAKNRVMVLDALFGFVYAFPVRYI